MGGKFWLLINIFIYPTKEVFNRKMPSTSMIRLIIFLLLIISLANCASTHTFARQHSDFDIHCDVIEDIAILPPNVEIYLVSLGSTKKPMKHKIEEVSNYLITLIGDKLKKLGFKTVPVSIASGQKINSEALFQDANIRNLFQQLNKEHKSVPIEQSKKLDCNLGDQAVRLASQTESDALIFLKFTGWKKSGGMIATEVSTNLLIAVATAGLIINPAKPAGAEGLSIALVDGKTGDVLWVNQSSDFYINPIPPSFSRDSIKSLVEDVFEGFPK